MQHDAETIRREAAVLARRKHARSVHFSSDAPTDWRPQTVINPDDGQPFTETAAWDLIADLLERGEPLECVPLQKPLGKKGYVMTVFIGTKPVYIKFQMGAGKIIGRSFHPGRSA